MTRRVAVVTTLLLLSGLTPAVATPAAALLAPASQLCFSPPAASPNGVAIVNVTPVGARAPGWGRVVPLEAIDAVSTSNVNFAPGTVNPNIAVVPIGPSGVVCYVTSDGGDSDVVIDTLSTMPAGALDPAVGSRPTRVVDTRTGLGGERLSPGERRCFPVPGAPGGLAIVNLTPVGAVLPGHGQLISSGTTGRPNASNVNFGPGSVDPGVAAAKIGDDGTVCFLNSIHGEVDLVADHLTTIGASAYQPTSTGSPVRLIDTRTDPGGGTVKPSEHRCFTVEGATNGMAAVNLTVVNATAPGFGRLAASDEFLTPAISHVNFEPSSVQPNVAIARVGSDGQVCYVNSEHATVDVVADLLFHFNSFELSVRTLDTRIVNLLASACPTDRACVGLGGAADAGSVGPVPLGSLPLLRSTDSGVTWYHQNMSFGASSRGHEISCATTSTCFAFAESTLSTPANPGQWGAIMTRDLGITWFATSTRGARAAGCPTSAVCVLVGEYRPPFSTVGVGVAYISTDSGATWTQLVLPPDKTRPLSEIECWSPEVCVSGTVVFRTPDGWSTVTIT